MPHEEVIRYAHAKGVTVVAASGNDGSFSEYYPAALPHVITVGASNVSDSVAAFSTWGDHVDLVAPGTDIFSTYLHNSCAFSSGTSHASPFVSGAVALLKSFALKNGEEFSDAQVKHLLKHTADRLDTRIKHPRAGFGQLNVRDALRLAGYRLETLH